MKEEVRSLYAELQGYLSQVPVGVSETSWTQDRSLWTQLNHVVEQLNQLTGKDYSRFKITPVHRRVTQNSSPYETVRYSTYKASLGALIAKIHVEYFRDEEEPPFRTMPNTVINQTQTQTQSLNVILEIQEKLITEIPKHKEGSKERTFLEKVKTALPSIKTGTDILSSVLKIGAEVGLDASKIHSLLHL